MSIVYSFIELIKQNGFFARILEGPYDSPNPYLYYATGPPPVPPDHYEKFGLKVGIILAVVIFIASLLINKFLIDPMRKSGNKKKATIATIIANVILVSLFFGGVEGALRMYNQKYPYQIFEPDPITHWKIRVDRRINALSGEEVPDPNKPKPEGVYRIFLTGDSQTAVPGGHAYPDKLQQILDKKYPKKKFQVINGAVPGYSSFQARMMVERLGVFYHPDLMLIAVGFHDSGEARAPDKDILFQSKAVTAIKRVLYKSELYLLLRKQALENRNEIIGWTVDSDENPEKKVNKKPSDAARRPYFNRVSKEDYRKNLEYMIKLARESNSKIALVGLPQMPDIMDQKKTIEYAEVMKATAKANGVEYIDVITPFLEIGDHQEQLSLYSDGTHFTRKKGTKWVADVIYDRIKQIIEK